ncbi:MAG: molybdate ABC transporter permease subunit [Desulfovibrionaceae bacterium]
MDWIPLILSAKLALATTVFIPVVAAPAAYMLAFYRFPGKSVLDSCITLPMVLPPTVLGFGLLMIMAPHGWLGETWAAAGGGRLVFTFPGILLASLVFNLPFAVQPLRASFQKLDRRLLESAAILGLSRTRSFFRVVLPNCLGGLAAASILVFAHSLGEFGVILMVGGSVPGQTKVASIAIYEAVEAMRYDDAILLSLALVPVSFLVLLVINTINERRS